MRIDVKSSVKEIAAILLALPATIVVQLIGKSTLKQKKARTLQQWIPEGE